MLDASWPLSANNGYPPFPGQPLSFDRVRSGAKDALWALDFFAVRKVRSPHR